MMNIVLLEPEMPSNTGNIGRTCVATRTRLHLIEPLGFKLNEKALKRAGLDYWDKLNVTVYSDYQDFLERNPQARGSICHHQSPQGVFRCVLQAGLLSHVRQGKRRHPGGDSGGQ